jgi:hypothetical protein
MFSLQRFRWTSQETEKVNFQKKQEYFQGFAFLLFLTIFLFNNYF